MTERADRGCSPHAALSPGGRSWSRRWFLSAGLTILMGLFPGPVAAKLYRPNIQTIGKYQILERVARYGVSSWFRARDPEFDRLVTLEAVPHEGVVPEALRTRFYRMAGAWARLSHPNLVRVLDVGEDERWLFIALEFLEGEELRRLISDRRKLSLEEKLSLMVQICDALHHLHQNGIVHRDVKPAHIFVLRTGQVKITRFELAKMAADKDEGRGVGTLRYMPPEQARGHADYRSDIFSIGAVFYELLTYRPAFDASDPRALLAQIRSENPPLLTEVDPAIPHDLATVVQRALEKDPARRFSDLAEMRARLKRIADRLSRPK